MDEAGEIEAYLKKNDLPPSPATSIDLNQAPGSGSKPKGDGSCPTVLSDESWIHD